MEVTLQGSQLDAAQDTEDFFLAVVAGLSDDSSELRVRFIFKPLALSFNCHGTMVPACIGERTVSKILEQRVQRVLEASGIENFRVVYVPPEDETVDGEIELLLMGVPSALTLQIGYDGLSVVEHLFEDGELSATQFLGDFERGQETEAIEFFVNQAIELSAP